MKHAEKQKTAQENDNTEKVIVSIRSVDADVWHKFKIEAAKRDIPLGELLSQIVDELGW
jgi:hypothetical protein